MLEPSVVQDLNARETVIAITGASGWIGMATLELLEQALGEAFEHRIRAYGSTERALTLRSGRQVVQQPLDALGNCLGNAIWLLHFAFLTKDRAEDLSEAHYRAANDAISRTVLEATDRLPVEALFVASSGAASKANDPAASAAMRLYGQMKLEDEDRFAVWAEARGKRVVISRIFNITGPYINKHQAYAMANFILDVIEGRPIAVRAPNLVIRSYVAISELMSLVFALMADGPAGVVRFDTGGDALELSAVAQIVSDTLGGQGVDRAAITEAVRDRYVGDVDAYAALLVTRDIATVPLAAQVRETARYLQSLHA